MRVAFLHSDKPREGLLADAVLKGAAKHGHKTEAFPLGQTPEPGRFEVVCMVGVKSRELFQAHQHAGAHVAYFDKGYCRGKSTGPVRGWEYWRVSVDAHHPTDRLSADHDGARWRALGLELLPWRKTGDHILLAGSSAKYHAFYGMKEPTTFAKGVVRELRAITDMPIVYRPKPSWREAVPIIKTRFSTSEESIVDVLTDCWALVTHGSNACFEAMISGIPAIVLGDAVTKHLSSTTTREILQPRLASDDERLRWAHAIAWWQYTLGEFASGAAWEFIEGQLYAQ